MQKCIKSRIRVVAAFVLFGASPLFAGPTGKDTNGSGIMEAQRYHFITEIPQGAINGWNTRFLLSQSTEPGSAVRLYRNGVSLRSPADYQIQGNAITFSPQQVPQTGDTLSISYVSANTGIRSTGMTEAVPAVSRDLDEISIAATRNALRAEAPNTSQGEQGTLANDRAVKAWNRRKSAYGGSEALQLLSYRIADSASGVADGIEGLGDSPIPSAYSAPRGLDRAEGAAIRGNTSAFAQPGEDPEPQKLSPGERASSAIDMLENRVSSQDPQDLRSIAEGFRPSPQTGNSPHDDQRGEFTGRQRTTADMRSSQAMQILQSRSSLDDLANAPR